MPGPDTGHTADTGTMWVALPAQPAACETAALQQQPVLSNLYTQASDVIFRITIIYTRISTVCMSVCLSVCLPLI